ncbi:MAG: hypothetical protein AAGF88_05220 [Pseudomonadota bacterium]
MILVLTVILAAAFALYAKLELSREAAREGFDRDASRKHKVPGLHVGKYLVGGAMIGIASWIFVVLAVASRCVTGQDADGNAVFDQGTATCTWFEGDYVVLTEWQSGLSAILALLGVAYGAMLAAIMQIKLPLPGAREG